MPKPAPTFYIFHGADEFTRAETLADFKRRLGPPDTVDLNTTILDGGTLTLAKLRHACDAIPFLAEKRLVIVEGLLTRLAPRKDRELSTSQRELLTALADYLPRLPETTRLVFIEDKPLPARHSMLRLAQREERGYVKRFDPPDAKVLPRWIEKRVRKYGGEIEPQAARQLAAVVGTDRSAERSRRSLRLLDQEIIKLVTYTQSPTGGQAITIADIETVVPYAQAAVVFDLVDALGRRDGRTAAQTLHRLLDAGEHPLGLLAMIVRQFRLLIQVKELKAGGSTPHDIAKALRLHPFPARKLHTQATHFTAAQLEAVYRHLLDTDVAIKTGKIDPEVALDLLVAGLATTET
ncbi:MAG: DNA polymerase III subunit delta [Anaerolineae bacterium]|nr:DNA polymerase III subunit delta [Anaerolineae bacterium]